MAVKEAAAALPALSAAADRSAAATLSVAMTMPATRRRERQRRSMQPRRLMDVLSRERDPGWHAVPVLVRHSRQLFRERRHCQDS